MILSDIESEGYNACSDGKDLTHNEYTVRRDYDAWSRGFRHCVRDEKEKRKESKERVFVGKVTPCALNYSVPLEKMQKAKVMHKQCVQQVIVKCSLCLKDKNISHGKLHMLHRVNAIGKNGLVCFSCHEKGKKELNQAIINISKRKLLMLGD